MAMGRLNLTGDNSCAYPARSRSSFLIASVGAMLTSLAMYSVSSTPATGQDVRPNRVLIEYVPPKNPEHQALYEQLKQRRSLERMQEIFKPFRLPIDLTLRVQGCDGADNSWYQRPIVTICYEYIVEDILKHVPTETTSYGITRENAMSGPFFYVVAHEMGHAVFDLLGVPLFGSPEDSADRFSALLMLTVGREEARGLIGGAATAYRDYIQRATVTAPTTAFASLHGSPMSRFYTLLCLAYGADQKMFADIVERGLLPAGRANSCRIEFQEINYAFNKVILPHLDPEMVKEILATGWMPPPVLPDRSTDQPQSVK